MPIYPKTLKIVKLNFLYTKQQDHRIHFSIIYREKYLSNINNKKICIEIKYEYNIVFGIKKCSLKLNTIKIN